MPHTCSAEVGTVLSDLGFEQSVLFEQSALCSAVFRPGKRDVSVAVSCARGRSTMWNGCSNQFLWKYEDFFAEKSSA